MEGLLDRASPRRGSLTSLHKYSGGSFSHNPKLGSPSNTLQINNGNMYALCKDLDKFTRYFIVKAVQVIVQSRIGDGHKLRADCKPNGNDWFNINISDIVEVSDKTKAVLDAEGLSVKSNWRVCCEISLKTNDGNRIVLEHWIISNKSNLNSNQKLSSSGQASPKSFMTNRSLNTHLTSSNLNNGGGGASPGRERTATFSSTSRTRLNSIDDYTTENNYVPNKVPLSTNNENIDVKPSTSCYSLSSGPNTNLQSENNNLIIASTSTNSLNTNATASASSAATITANTTNQTQDYRQSATCTNLSALQQQNQSNQNSTAAATSTTNKTSATSSIYTIYNRMSLLLKTLLTTTHVVPAYRLASRTSRTDSCVICYRVYTVPRHVFMSRGSIEDINSNLHHSESPNKRSLASTSSLGSADIREFVDSDDLEHFCPILKLGSIKTDVSEIEVAVCYRTDLRNPSCLLKNSKPRDKYNRILDEDCLTAAKQLLAGNECLRDSTYNNQGYHDKNGSQNSLNNDNRYDRRALDFLDQPLKPAFANVNTNSSAIAHQGGGDSLKYEGMNGCELIESAFDRLLAKKCSPSDDDLIYIASDAIGKREKDAKLAHRNVQVDKNSERGSNGNTNNGNSKSENAHSDPIQVPNQGSRKQSDQHTSGSTPKSLTDSYVFVELNPPFASEEQNDINSFFHGPSPSFSNGSSNLRDVDELTNQLATIEANASQIDDFVDNMCASEDDEEEEEDDDER